MTRPRRSSDDDRERVARTARSIAGHPADVCSCPQCGHPTVRHGAGYVDIGAQRLMVMACLDCPRKCCLITPVQS